MAPDQGEGPGADVPFLPSEEGHCPPRRQGPSCRVTSPVPQVRLTGHGCHSTSCGPPRVSLELVHIWSSAALLSILRLSPPGKGPRDTLHHPEARSIREGDTHSLELPRQEPIPPKDPVPPRLQLQGLPPLPDSSQQLHLDLQM